MRPSVRLLCTTGLALTASTGLTACDSSSDDFDIADYTGTYTGSASATVPGQTTPSAPFTATIATSGSNGVSIAFRATGQDGNVVAFTLRGTHSGSGATFTSLVEAPGAGVNIRVSGSGAVSGGITLPDLFGQALSLTASGAVTPSSLNLSLASTTPPGTFTVVGTK